MKLSFFEIGGTAYYEACIWENGNNMILCEFYTTKAEATKAVKTCKKSYKGDKEIDCFVRKYDENGAAIADYNL